MKEKAEETC